jgi:hypothetical protein
MKNRLTASMPMATAGRVINAKMPPDFESLRASIEGKLPHCQTRTIAATGTTAKKAPRHPTIEPKKLPSGAAITVASALPPFTIARAFGTFCNGTSRIAVAADMDQKPPMATPTSARPIMKDI